MDRGNAKSNGIWLILILLLILSRPANLDADCYAWRPGPPISGGQITFPIDNTVLLCGSKAQFTCNRGTDNDESSHWEQNQPFYPAADAMHSNWPRWTCSGGKWLDGSNRGTSVYWLAPDSQNTGIVLKIFENDLPNAIYNDGCSYGSRDDDEALQDTKTVKAIVPLLDQVTYGVSGTGAKISCDEPEWQRNPAKNVEVCWLKLSNATAAPQFWYSENLTVAPGNVEVRGETSNDDDNIGDWLEAQASWGTGWPQPSGALVCESGKDMGDEIQTCEYETQWRYRCLAGTNNWIDVPKQTNLIFHVVDRDTIWTDTVPAGFGCPVDCTPIVADKQYDGCNNWYQKTCQPSTFMGGACGYHFWYNGTLVGLCIYDGGINDFEVRWDTQHNRYMDTRHMTYEPGTDQGTPGVCDWQLTFYDCINGGPVRGYCRQGAAPDWIEVSNSDCENEWW